MSIRKANGTRVSKTQLAALMTPVTTPAVFTVNEHIYMDYDTSPGTSNFEQQRRKVFHAGQQITQDDIDALFPTATFTSITPATGAAAGSTDVTIKGTNFSGVAGVTIGGVACTDVEVHDSTTITCTTGAHAAGAVNVVIADDKADVTATNAYTYA